MEKEILNFFFKMRKKKFNIPFSKLVLKEQLTGSNSSSSFLKINALFIATTTVLTGLLVASTTALGVVLSILF